MQNPISQNPPNPIQQFQQLIEDARNGAKVLADLGFERASQLERQGQRQLASALRDRIGTCYRNIHTCLSKITITEDAPQSSNQATLPSTQPTTSVDSQEAPGT